MAILDGLENWWSFKENDAEYYYHGYIDENTWRLTSGDYATSAASIVGKIGRAFDGYAVQRRIYRADSASLFTAITNAFSISLWFCVPTGQAWHYPIVLSNSVNSNSIWLCRNGADNQLQFHVRYAGIPGEYTINAIADSNLNDGVFHHIAAVFDTLASDGLKLKIYIDGILKGSGVGLPATVGAQGYQIILNKYNYLRADTNCSNCKIDDTGLWTRALTAAEVTTLAGGYSPAETKTVTGKVCLNPFNSFEGRLSNIPDLAASYAAPIGTGDFSMGFWFKNPARCKDYLLFQAVKDTAGSAYVRVGWDQGQHNLIAKLHSGSTDIIVSAPYQVQAAQQLLFLTCDRSETDGLKLWLNGEVIASADPAPLVDVDFTPGETEGYINFNFGADPMGNNIYNQIFDDIQLYAGVALSETDMAGIWNDGLGVEFDENEFLTKASNGFYCNFNTFTTHDTCEVGSISASIGQPLINGYDLPPGAWNLDMIGKVITIAGNNYTITNILNEHLLLVDAGVPANYDHVAYSINSSWTDYSNIPAKILIENDPVDYPISFATYAGVEWTFGGVPFDEYIPTSPAAVQKTSLEIYDFSPGQLAVV